MAEIMANPARTYNTFAEAIADGQTFRGVHMNTGGDITFVDHAGASITLTLAGGVSHPIGGKSLTSGTGGYVIRG